METYLVDSIEEIAFEKAEMFIINTFTRLTFSVHDSNEMMETDLDNLSKVCNHDKTNFSIITTQNNITMLSAKYKETYYVWDTDFGFQLCNLILPSKDNNKVQQPCCKCKLDDKWNSLGKDDNWYCYQHCDY